MFNRIAHRYDMLNAILSLGRHRYWRRVAVQQLSPLPAKCYLDVGCGTGDTMAEILRHQPQAKLVGLDPAQSMLEIATRKLQDHPAGAPAQLCNGDATALQFATGSFAGVTASFCIRNIGNRALALTEMHRVLVEHGRLVILELTLPKPGLLRLAYNFYALLIPIAGALFSQPTAYTYLIESIRRFPGPETVVAMLQQAGFQNVTAIALTGGVVTCFIADKSAAPAPPPPSPSDPT